MAHHLLGEAALRRQRAASANFLFRWVVLLCEQVERRKGKRGGGVHEAERLPVPLASTSLATVCAPQACFAMVVGGRFLLRCASRVL